ncbi:MAG: S-layer homology domain-containing protein, partial [Elusimicrobiales bacterium]|nr:S-layer homology domain-containing protein [Elusimicrobiales bacterium]
TLGVHTLDIDFPEDPTFADVVYAGDPYPYDFVEEAAAAGIVVGYTDGSFGPYNPVTRAQLITMVARAAGLPPAPTDYQPPFLAFDQVHYPWARTAAAAGLLEGLAGLGDSYEFYAPASRGEVCALLFNLLD